MSSFENFVKCRVVSPVAAAATDIALYEAVAPFNLPPEEGGILVLTDSPNNPSVIEVIRYGYRNALGLYDVQRGQEGTTSIAWTGPVYCYQSLMAGDFQALLDSKVDKAAGESLMLDAERTKLAGIQAGAQVNSVTSVAGKTGDVTLTKGDVGLGNVDNTSDANKPVSTAQQAALNAKAPLASPALTGTPTAPTPAAGTNTTQIANTAFVQAALAALVDSSPATLDTLNELAAALGDDPNFATTMTNALALKAPLASPALTGNPTAPTPAADDSDTSIATTAFVRAAMALFGLGYAGGPTVSDPNTLRNTGIYSGGGAGAVNFPDSVTGYGPLLNLVRSTSVIIQIGMFGSSGNDPVLWVRGSNDTGATWSAWRQFWHTGNLVKQTSATDTTAGAMMAVGAFGLGALAAPSFQLKGTSLLNEAHPTGFYQQPSATGVTDTPSPLQQCQVLVLRWGPAGNNNVTLQAFGVGSDQGRQWFNTYRAATGLWSGWREVYHTGNILGTVSQSGGVPTGAIIERGSNANGEYVRFADGTQICWQRFSGLIPNSAHGYLFKSAHVNWTFPAVFTGSPTTQGCEQWGNGLCWLALGAAPTSATSTSFALFSATTTTASSYIGISAIGRWY